MSQSQENFRTEGQKEGQTLIHRTPPDTAGGSKNLLFLFIYLFIYLFLQSLRLQKLRS